MGVRIEIATEATSELVEAFGRLLPQLSRSSPPPSAEQVAEVVASPATDQFVATTDNGRIAGLSTLVTFRIPTGLRAWIEDVVVDTEARGQGIGEALNRAMLDQSPRARLRHRRPHQPSEPRGRQPPLPAHRFHPTRDQRLPVRA